MPLLATLTVVAPSVPAGVMQRTWSAVATVANTTLVPNQHDTSDELTKSVPVTVTVVDPPVSRQSQTTDSRYTTHEWDQSWARLP
jgi:hypothetical protein